MSQCLAFLKWVLEDLFRFLGFALLLCIITIGVVDVIAAIANVFH